MHTLLRRITLGIGTGAALALGGASCSASLQRPDTNDDADANGFATDAADNMQERDARVIGHVDASLVEHVDASRLRDATLDTSVSADLDASGASKDAATEVLAPFPLDLDCVQEDAGWCCYMVTCHVVDGSCPYLDPYRAPIPVASHLAHCERPGAFARNLDYPYPLWPDADGNCCYLLPTDGIAAGRPFTSDGTAQVAPVILRHDWLAA